MTTPDLTSHTDADVQALLARFVEVTARLETAEATIARVKALAAYGTDPHETRHDVIDGYQMTTSHLTTVDGSLILVGQEAVWVRNDTDNPYPDGDWWEVGTDHSRSSVIDVLDNGEGRRPKTFEVLLTADDVNAALRGE
jgi:hypothetical protein